MRPDEGPEVFIINFNGDEVDCTLERDVVEEIVKLLFFIVDDDDEIKGVEFGLLTSFDVVGVVTEFEVNIGFFCNTDDIDKCEIFGMRITIGSRLTVDNVPLPFVDSLVEETILGLLRIGVTGLAHPLCPFICFGRFWTVTWRGVNIVTDFGVGVRINVDSLLVIGLPF